MKPNLPLVNFIPSTSLGASFSSSPIRIFYQDNVAIQLDCTTSDAVGTFAAEVSVDYQENFPDGMAQNGNWVALPLPSTPTLAGANQVIILNLNQLSMPYIRISYTRTSGSGTVNGFIVGKVL